MKTNKQNFHFKKIQHSEKLHQFVLNGQLKLLMEFILYEWVIVNFEIINAALKKPVISRGQSLHGKPMVPNMPLSESHGEIGGHTM